MQTTELISPVILFIFLDRTPPPPPAPNLPSSLVDPPQSSPLRLTTIPSNKETATPSDEENPTNQVTSNGTKELQGIDV